MVAQKTTDLVIKRVFDAPREAVWKAWTDPESMKKWWGPENFTCPTAKLDVRVGGKMLLCMRDPDGNDYWSTGIFQEIVPYEKLVFTDSFADAEGNVVPASHYGMSGIPMELLVTITFEDLGGKTRMTLIHSGFPEGEHKDGARDGWSTSLDKLEKSLMV